jgi:Fe-S cluster assembly scaffold protein SufB
MKSNWEQKMKEYGLNENSSRRIAAGVKDYKKAVATLQEMQEALKTGNLPVRQQNEIKEHIKEMEESIDDQDRTICRTLEYNHKYPERVKQAKGNLKIPKKKEEGGTVNAEASGETAAVTVPPAAAETTTNQPATPANGVEKKEKNNGVALGLGIVAAAIAGIFGFRWFQNRK